MLVFLKNLFLAHDSQLTWYFWLVLLFTISELQLSPCADGFQIPASSPDLDSKF